MKTTSTVPATTAFAEDLFTKRVETFDCLGSDKVAKAFGLTLDQATVPAIPFTEEELKRARKLGQFLILHAPTTMQQLHSRLNNVLGDGKLLYDIDWYKGEQFYTTETTRLEWRLVGREVISGSTGQNYLSQTQVLADYVREHVYGSMELPAAYQAAIKEFEDRKDELERLADKDWKAGAEAMANLQLNRLFRGTPADTLFDVIAYFKVNGEYLLPNMYHWSASRSSRGNLVGLGFGGAGGVYVRGFDPRNSLDNLGVVFSRGAIPSLVS